jgi:hypothetical protein
MLLGLSNRSSFQPARPRPPSQWQSCARPLRRQQQGIGSDRRRCGKKAYPVVMVTVVDAEDGTIEVVKE